jgi:hypothetical protein
MHPGPVRGRGYDRRAGPVLTRILNRIRVSVLTGIIATLCWIFRLERGKTMLPRLEWDYADGWKGDVFAPALV